MEHIIGTLLQDFEWGKITRRQLIQSLALAGTAAAANASQSATNDKVVKASYLNHISYQVSDFAKTRDFYADLFGMKVSLTKGKDKECRLSVGDSLIIAHTRSSGPSRIDHIAFSVANWDTDKNVRDSVKSELMRRGLEVRPAPQELGGVFIKDPDGFDVQIGGSMDRADVPA